MLATTWSLALAALAALAVAVDGACPVGYEPLNKSMRWLKTNGSLTWREADSQCDEQFPGGFQMLNRDFLHVSDEVRALCKDRWVPLKLRQETGRRVVWAASKYLKDEGREENVSYAYRESKLADEALNDAAARVGALNLSTGQWRLVDESTTFDCVICQRDWVAEFWRLVVLPANRPGPFKGAYTFRLVSSGNGSTAVDEAIRMVEERINGTVDRHGNLLHAKIGKVASDPGGNGTLLRSSSVLFVWRDVAIKALRGTFSIESWWNMNYCPDTRFQGFDWEKILSGNMRRVRLPDFRVATRRCGWRSYPHGDWDAVWDDEIFFWIDREEDCRAHGVSNLLRQLQAFAKRVDSGALDLEFLVETTDELASLELPIDIANVSREVVGVLSSLLIATTTNASSACHGSACAFLAADFQGAEGHDTLLISHERAPLRFLSLNESGAAVRATFMSLHFPRALTLAGRVAVHAWSGLNNLYFRDKNIAENAMLVQVVSTRPFDESTPERSRPAVIFRLNNSGVGFIDRYRSVWSLGVSAKSSQPCVWIRSEGSIDTYWCNKWVGSHRNFTAGTFIATKFASHGGFPELIENQVLLGYESIPLDEYALDRVVAFLNFDLKNSRIKSDKLHWSFINVMNNLEKFLNDVVLTEEFAFIVNLDHFKVLVSDLTVSNPVVGFSLERLAGVGAVQTITAGPRNVSAESEVDLVLGPGVQKHSQQLAMLIISGLENFRTNSSLEAYVKRKLMIVYMVVTSRNSGDVFFEIQFLGESEQEYKNTKNDTCSCCPLDLDEGKVGVMKVNHIASLSSVVKPKLRIQVATWSETARDWLVSSCANRRSTRDSKLVVRCTRLPYVDKQSRGRYLVFDPAGFAEAFGTTLLTVLIAAGILSAVSLASIAATAVALPNWRKDLGHKILLQMALVLSFNLALGFQSSLVSVDTASVACVAVGALRHFSYLAMFAWLLVMSGLQLRRLLSVFGSRTTSNLLLKVSFFAWGVPTIVIGSLLTFKTDMYESDAADRGYCYPEGVAFRWSVQAPAATVLVLNFSIFLVILARVYDLCCWGETKDLQRHLNEHTTQMRRLRAIFYTFCLFGMTWTFHLLAEQGVFPNKYLYEYLFLMTASLHVFSLSCIFVLFDREARAEWAQVISKARKDWANWLILAGTWLGSVASRIVTTGERIQAEQL